MLLEFINFEREAFLFDEAENAHGNISRDTNQEDWPTLLLIAH
jgi:hypothetical protein